MKKIIVFILLASIVLSGCQGKRSTVEHKSIDLHKVYYSLSTLKLLGGEIDKKNLKYIVSTVEDEHKKYFFDESKFDNLSNIYYFNEITKFLDYEYIPPFKKQLINYIYDLQTNNGGFAFSQIHRDQVNNSGSSLGETFLSTYMASSILRDYAEPVQNNIKVKNWLRTMINSKFISKNEIVDYTYLYIQIAKMVNYNDFEWSFMREIVKSNVEKINSSEKLVLMDLNLIIESTSLFELVELINHSKVHNGILEYADSSGKYKASKFDEPNILPTYIAIKFLVYDEFEIPNKKDLILEIQKDVQIY